MVRMLDLVHPALKQEVMGSNLPGVYIFFSHFGPHTERTEVFCYPLTFPFKIILLYLQQLPHKYIQANNLYPINHVPVCVLMGQ